jgi:hypothetical protein
MDPRMNHFKSKYFFAIMLLLVSAMPLLAHLKAGQKLTYDVTFGNVLKGHAVIKFFGDVASFTEVETLTVMADSAIIDAGLDFLSESTLVIEADSIVKYCPIDSVGEAACDSSAEEKPIAITTVKKKVHSIFYITYDTKFIGNIYNLHADIYTNEDFFPLLIETQITRTGNKSKGKELFFPDRNMAIFSQIIEGVEEVDTLWGEHSLQDITTLPFFFSGQSNGVGNTLDVSLPQGEYKLTYVDTEIIEYGEGHDYRYYHTYRIESEPKGFTLWLHKNSNVPVKVHIESQKIKMILSKREIDKSANGALLPEDKIKQKLAHIFPLN